MLVIKKHHPPKGEDEVWRLEGIGKDGKYHKRLSSKGIKNVCVFIKAYKRDPGSLRKVAKEIFVLLQVWSLNFQQCIN